MSRVLYRVGRACFAHRWLVVVTWLLVVIAAGAGMKISGGQLDNTFTIPGSPSQTALDQVQQDFPVAGGTSAQLVFAARGGTTVTSPANAAAISQVLSKAAAAPQVAAVVPPDKSHLVTKDGKTAIGTVEYKVSAADLDSGTLDALSSIASAADSSTLSVQPGGQAFSSLSSGSGSSEVTGLLIAFAVLAVALASLAAAGMPLLTALTGVAVSVLTLHGLAAALSVSNTAVTLAVMIGLAVGVDYALFILSRHRAQLAAGLSPAESAAMAVGTAGTAVVFAGCTVIIALAALSVVGIPFLTVMGLAAAGTVLTAVLIATTLLPAIFGIAGSRLAPRPGSRAARLARRTAQAGGPGQARPTRGARWLAAVTRRPAAALAAAVVVLGALAVPALKLTLALPDNGSAASATSQRTAFDTISSTFGPGYNGPLLVLATLNPGPDPAAATQQADAVAAKLKGFAGVAAVTPPQLDQAHTAALIDVVPASAPSAAATATLVTSIRGQAGAISGATGASVAVTGTTAIDVDVSAKLSAALLPFAGIVVGLSLLLLMLVFRSLIVPVKAATGFLLSVGASFGATVAVFQWGWLAGPLGATAGPVASFLPIVLMAVLFGLAMDYEVFLVSRIREDYTRSQDPRHAIIAGGGAAARVVVAAAVIMTCIFASFLLSGDATIKSLALALAVGVACDALLVRMTIVPAVLALAGQHAWYIPRWLDHALPDLDIEGTSLRRPTAPPAERSEKAGADSEKAGAGQHQTAEVILGSERNAPEDPGPQRADIPDARTGLIPANTDTNWRGSSVLRPRNRRVAGYSHRSRDCHHADPAQASQGTARPPQAAPAGRCTGGSFSAPDPRPVIEPPVHPRRVPAMELKNKVALITGATAGIGREAAMLLAAEGAEIIVTGRHTERGAATAGAITDDEGAARFVQADLADLASLRHLAREAGEVDILVNNAAAFPMGPALSVSAEAFDAAMATNVRAPYFLTAALAPAMIAKGSGSIINITTMAAYVGMPGTSAYGATKAALSSLTRTWAAEFSTAGVRVNSLSPGPTRTDTVVTAMGDAAAEQVGKTTLLGRQASPREIAEVILFLASDRSSYITGATIAVDAGRTAI